MERELWSILSRSITDVARTCPTHPYHTHQHALVVRVYLWAVLHDRPVSWACRAQNWDARTRPKQLPSQSTMSRRLRTPVFQHFVDALSRRLKQQQPHALNLLKRIDGKALLVSSHSQDRDATWGPASGKRLGRGYKFHAIWAENAMPELWEVRPLNHNEKNVAAELLPQLTGSGYVLGDGFYHANRLFTTAAQVGHQLIAPRRDVGTSIRQPKRFDPARLRCIDLLETDAHRFGPTLFAQRKQIETRFGHLCSFGGGLTHLPPWVRGLQTVERYVQAKLIINAARIKRIRA